MERGEKKVKSVFSTSFEEVVKLCESISSSRQAKYGDITCKEYQSDFVELVRAIYIDSDFEEVRNLYESMLALKAARALYNPSGQDHYIDFINYLVLVKRTGFEVELNPSVFGFAEEAEGFFSDLTSLELLVKAIHDRGFFTNSFLRDHKR